MLVAPRPGCKYRHPATMQLVLEDESFEADPNDLDIARGLDCGDLVPVKAPKASKAPQE